MSESATNGMSPLLLLSSLGTRIVRHCHCVVCHQRVVLVVDSMGLGHHHHHQQNSHCHHHLVDHNLDDMIHHHCHCHCHLNNYLLMCFDVCLQEKDFDLLTAALPCDEHGQSHHLASAIW